MNKPYNKVKRFRFHCEYPLGRKACPQKTEFVKHYCNVCIWRKEIEITKYEGIPNEQIILPLK